MERSLASWSRRGKSGSLPRDNLGAPFRQRGQQEKGPRWVRAVTSEEGRGSGSEKVEEAGHQGLWAVFIEQGGALRGDAVRGTFGFTVVKIYLWLPVPMGHS